MAANRKKTTGWGFRLVVILLTLLVTAGVFAYSFSGTGNEVKAMLHGAIPFAGAVFASYLLGKIGKLSHKRWQIYLAVLLIAAVATCLRISGVF